MARLLAALGVCLALGAGMAPAHAEVSPQEAKDMVQQQSFKLVELMYTLKRDGEDAKTTTMGAAVLFHMTARFAHLADLSDLAKVVKDPAARNVLEERWDALQNDVYSMCLLEPESLDNISKTTPNAKVVAEIKASRKVLEAACEAAYAKLPGK